MSTESSQEKESQVEVVEEYVKNYNALPDNKKKEFLSKLGINVDVVQKTNPYNSGIIVGLVNGNVSWSVFGDFSEVQVISFLEMAKHDAIKNIFNAASSIKKF